MVIGLLLFSVVPLYSEFLLLSKVAAARNVFLIWTICLRSRTLLQLLVALNKNGERIILLSVDGKYQHLILEGITMKLLVLTLTILFGAVAAAPLPAQQPAKTWKIGVLVSSSQAQNVARDDALRQGLRDLGYEENKNISMEFKYAEGKFDRLPQLARELVDHKVDVIVVGGTNVAVAAKNATSTIPIVVAGAGDLVEAGLIRSFMFPGGNVTGVARMSADFFGERLKLAKEILPKATQVAALINPKNPGHERSRKDAELGAKSQGLSFNSVSASSAGEINGAVTAAAKGGAQALFILTDALFNSHMVQLAQSSIKNKLPAFYDRNDFVDAGGLISYGVNLPELSRRAAEYVDKILKGAKPSDLPVERPTKFQLVINMKTAKTLGLTVPPAVIARADEVIE
jgi:putative ABC transport system substrate-binding protein